MAVRRSNTNCVCVFPPLQAHEQCKLISYCNVAIPDSQIRRGQHVTYDAWTIGWGLTGRRAFSNGTSICVGCGTRLRDTAEADDLFAVALNTGYWPGVQRATPGWEFMPDDMRATALDVHYNSPLFW
jgi:hypothetical protein